MIKYFVSDIDNTLFDAKTGIHQDTIQTLKTLQKQGITLVLASGRTLNAMKIVAEELDLKSYGGYLIGSNGASLQKADEALPWLNHCHRVEDLHRYVTKAIELDLHFSLEQNDILYYSHLDSSVVYEKDLCGVKTQQFSDPIKEIQQEISKLCVHLNIERDPSKMDVFVKTFQKEAMCERFHPHYMDVMPFGHSKLTGLMEILKLENAHLSEVAAIGDGFNDLDLLTHAGLSAAVANAKPTILDVVDMVVGRAIDAGVAQFAQHVLKLNSKTI